MSRPLRQLRERVQRAVRRAWMKCALRGVLQADAHRRLDLAYKLGDPWHMDSAPERFRFVETNRIIVEHIAPHVHSLLEIGCGEGHQSEVLARLCDAHTALDVSATAVARARRRLPDATVIAGELQAQPWSGERGRFDLVTACEVVHYMRDPRAFVDTIDRLGLACVVTYCAPVPRNAAMAVLAMPGVRTTSIRYGATEWTVAWWKGAESRADAAG